MFAAIWIIVGISVAATVFYSFVQEMNMNDSSDFWFAFFIAIILGVVFPLGIFGLLVFYGTKLVDHIFKNQIEDLIWYSQIQAQHRRKRRDERARIVAERKKQLNK